MTTAAKGAVLLLGGRSDIGGELALRVCAGREVVLASRGGAAGHPELEKQLLAAGATGVRHLDFDACDFDSHRAVVLAAGDVEIAIVAFGILGNQQRAEHDEAHAAEIATIDYTAQVSMLTVLADEMTAGHIVAFTSIAGWRARRANYVYGSTKAGLDAFCQGLADRLHGGPLALITARPGFVIGSMSAGMKPAPLSVTPDVVADYVAREIHRPRRRSVTLWIPGRLRFLAWVMRCVPRPLWRHAPR